MATSSTDIRQISGDFWGQNRPFDRLGQQAIEAGS
jgi:hypothetical protein